MRVLVVGPQGSGKSTIGKLIATKFSIPFINTGSLLRTLSSDHPHFEIINTAMSKGLLVPYEYAAEILRDRIHEKDCANGYVIDGWGRNAESLEFFDPEVDFMLYLEVSKATSLKRLTGRRVCADGSICNVNVSEDSELSCSRCSGELKIRPDDTKEAVEKRLDIFYKDTLDVVNYYKLKHKLVTVDAEPLPNEILASALEAIKEFNDKS